GLAPVGHTKRLRPAPWNDDDPASALLGGGPEPFDYNVRKTTFKRKGGLTAERDCPSRQGHGGNPADAVERSRDAPQPAAARASPVADQPCSGGPCAPARACASRPSSITSTRSATSRKRSSWVTATMVLPRACSDGRISS